MSPQSIPSSGKKSFLGVELIPALEFEIILNRPYIVKNFLYESQVSILAGPPNTGKSSIMASVAAHIANGQTFGESRVKRTAVLYVAAEDPYGIGARAAGFKKPNIPSPAVFEIFPDRFCLFDDERVSAFIQQCLVFKRDRRAERMLVVFDTLNLCIGDADENSSRDMSKVLANAQRIAAKTGAHVMLIHHTGNGETGRPRGSSTMSGNVDTIAILRRAQSEEGSPLVLLTQEKQRSVPKGKAMGFEIRSFFVGNDEDGDPVSVPMAYPVTADSSLIPKSKASGKQVGEGDSRTMEVLRVLCALRDRSPDMYHEAKDICGIVGEAFESVRNNQDSLRKAVARALKALVSSRQVEKREDGGFRATQLAQPEKGAPVTLH
jgi:hypothetical protein